MFVFMNEFGAKRLIVCLPFAQSSRQERGKFRIRACQTCVMCLCLRFHMLDKQEGVTSNIDISRQYRKAWESNLTFRYQRLSWTLH